MSAHVIGPAAIAVAGAIPGDGLAAEDVTPGVIGFLVTFALVVACIPLFRSMTGKLRGVQHRREPGDDGGERAGNEGALRAVDEGGQRTDEGALRAVDEGGQRTDEGAQRSDDGRSGSGPGPGSRPNAG